MFKKIRFNDSTASKSTPNREFFVHSSLVSEPRNDFHYLSATALLVYKSVSKKNVSLLKMNFFQKLESDFITVADFKVQSANS